MANVQSPSASGGGLKPKTINQRERALGFSPTFEEDEVPCRSDALVWASGDAFILGLEVIEREPTQQSFATTCARRQLANPSPKRTPVATRTPLRSDVSEASATSRPCSTRENRIRVVKTNRSERAALRPQLHGQVLQHSRSQPTRR
jgi:hypothetical protein